MPTGYTRQSAADIVTGNTINAAPLNNEFNQVQAAMDATTGHNHDGTAGGGAPISLTTSVAGLLPVAHGGTGASTASAARAGLGLAIGTDVQAYDPGLQSIAGLTTAANKMIYTTSSDVYAVADLTAAGRALLDDADATAQRATLGLGSIATQNAGAVNITGGTVDGVTITGGTVSSTITSSSVSATTLSVSGDVTITDKIIHSGDTDTAIRFPSSDMVTVETGGAERLRVTNTGIGVNVATPTEALHIADTIPSSGDNGILFQDLSDSTKSIFLNRTGPTHNYLGITGAVGRIYSSTSLALVADTVGGNNSILFSVGGALRATLQWDGRFGIGTASPATMLDVNGDVTITDKIIHSGDTDTSIRFPAVDTVAVETGGAERLRVTSAGSIGIGTTSPAARFHAAGSYTAPTGGIDAGVQGILSNTAGFAGLQILSGNASSAYIHLGDTDDADRGAIIYDHTTDQLQFHVSAAQRARITSTGLTVGSAELTTPSGSAPLYAARAWVNFNGTGTVAIRASGNVTSITDNGTANYTLNFTTAMPDANYAVAGSGEYNGGSGGGVCTVSTTYSTTACNIVIRGQDGSVVDRSIIGIVIFR